jgi:hypothetical protein
MTVAVGLCRGAIKHRHSGIRRMTLGKFILAMNCADLALYVISSSDYYTLILSV